MRAYALQRWLLAMCLIVLADAAPAQTYTVETLATLCGNRDYALSIERALTSRAQSPVSPQDTSQELRKSAAKLREMAHYDEALQAAYAALHIDLKAGAGANQLVGHDLAEIGLIHRWQSDSAALPALHCTLNIRQQAAGGHTHPSTASALVELANFEMAFRRWTKADEYLKQAVGILRVAPTEWSGHLAAALTSQANLRATYPEDLPPDERVLERRVLYEEALQVNRQLQGCEVECIQVAISTDSLARSWNEGSARVRSGIRAKTLAEKALATKLRLRGAVHDTTATTYQTLAQIAAAEGTEKRDQAFNWYRQASWTLQAAAAASNGSPPAILSRLAEVSAEFAMYSQAIGTPDATMEAILQYTVSVEARQRMRSGSEGLPESYRRDLTRSLADPYYQLATLLLEAGRIPESEAVIDLLKEEELANFLRGGGGTTARATYNQPTVLRMAEMARLSIEQAAERAQFEQVDPSTLTPAQSARLAELRAAAQKQIDDYQRFIASLSKQPDQQRAIADAVSRLQKRIRRDPNGAAGLRYVLAGRRVGIVVVLPDQEIARFSNVSEVALIQQIKALREAIQSRSDTKDASRELWRVLIDPVLPTLQQAKIKTLVLSLTGPLRYVPFAALLNSENQYLIEQFALASWPDAADGEPSVRSESWSVAAMGLTKTWGAWDPLPSVESELRAIVKDDAESTGVIPGKAWRSPEFTRDRFEASLRGPANLVHVATHFELKHGDERSSQLVLGVPNQLMSLRDLRLLNFDRVSLLTLSACQTALGGGVNENGLEVEGLAAVVLAKGAKSVVASLWKVPDASTSFLMKQFYASLVASKSVNLAAALQSAQLEVLAQSRRAVTEGSSSSADAQRTLWAHPFYWAPFVLSGHWR